MQYHEYEEKVIFRDNDVHCIILNSILEMLQIFSVAYKNCLVQKQNKSHHSYYYLTTYKCQKKELFLSQEIDVLGNFVNESGTIHKYDQHATIYARMIDRITNQANIYLLMLRNAQVPSCQMKPIPQLQWKIQHIMTYPTIRLHFNKT